MHACRHRRIEATSANRTIQRSDATSTQRERSIVISTRQHRHFGYLLANCPAIFRDAFSETHRPDDNRLSTSSVEGTRLTANSGSISRRRFFLIAPLFRRRELPVLDDGNGGVDPLSRINNTIRLNHDTSTFRGGNSKLLEERSTGGYRRWKPKRARPIRGRIESIQ